MSGDTSGEINVEWVPRGWYRDDDQVDAMGGYHCALLWKSLIGAGESTRARYSKGMKPRDQEQEAEVEVEAVEVEAGSTIGI